MKLFHAITKILRSHGGPNQLAFAAALGAFIGLMPLWGYHNILWGLVFIVLRLAPSALVLSVALFKVLDHYTGLNLITYQVGTYLLDQTSPAIVHFWKTVCSLPLVSAMGFDRYAVTGSFALAIPSAIVAYIFVRILYKLLADSKLSKFVKASRPVTSLRSTFVGDEPFVGNRFVRAKLLVLLAIATALAAVAISLGGGSLLKTQIATYGQQLLGATVQIQTASWNALDGRLLLSNVTISDPTNSERILFSTSQIEANVNMGSLTYGQIVLEKVTIAEATLRLGRTGGELNFTRLSPLDLSKISPEDRKTIKLDTVAPPQFGNNPADWVEQFRKWASEYDTVARYKKVLRRQTIENYAEKNPNAMDIVTGLLNIPSLARIEHLLTLSESELRQKLGRPRYLLQPIPRVICNALYLPNLKIECDLQPAPMQTIVIALTIQNLSSSPANHNAVLGSLKAQNVDLKAFAPVYQNSSPLIFAKGEMALELSFVYTGEHNTIEGKGQMDMTALEVSHNLGVLSTIDEQRLERIKQQGRWLLPFSINGNLPYPEISQLEEGK